MIYRILVSNIISILLNVHGFCDRIVQWTRKFFYKNTLYFIFWSDILFKYISNKQRIFQIKNTKQDFFNGHRIFSYRCSYLYFTKYISLAYLTISFPFVSGVYRERLYVYDFHSPTKKISSEPEKTAKYKMTRYYRTWSIAGELINSSKQIFSHLLSLGNNGQPVDFVFHSVHG